MTTDKAAQAMGSRRAAGFPTPHRILLAVTILLGIVAATMVTLAAMRSAAIHGMRKEAEQTRQQATSLVGSRWCDLITADNDSQIPTLYSEYATANEAKQSAIDASCPKRVEAAEIITQHHADSDFKFTDSTCGPSADGSHLRCSVTVEANNENLRQKLSTFSSVDITMKLEYAENLFNSAFYRTLHVEENVATVRLSPDCRGSLTFDAPYDPAWGRYYGLYMTSFFPNE